TDPIQQLAGRDGRDGAVGEVGEIAGHDDVHAGRHGAADRDVVLEVAGGHGGRAVQNHSLHGNDVEGREAVANTFQGDRLPNQSPGDVEQVRDRPFQK